jgi:hypothetical protein
LRASLGKKLGKPYPKKQVGARHQGLTPVNLSTWEAEIRRIMVQDHLGK